MDRADTLVVFARYPTPGRVKTRLAAHLGDESAARLYDAFVRDLADRLVGAAFRVRWAVAPPDPGFAERFGVDAGECFAQVGADLGERMHRAFEAELVAPNARCVLIGSDAPHLPVARVDEAFARLAEADVVLGPARDGGYYLIGLRRPHDVFSGVAWSHSSVLARTKERAAALGLVVAELETDFDVDEIGDLELLRDRLRRADVSCPATRRVLDELAPR